MSIDSLGVDSTAEEVGTIFGESGCRGKSFLVTGARSGLGKEIVQALSYGGACKVFAMGRPGTIVESMDCIGENIVRVSCDLASFASVHALARHLIADLMAQSLDCLILNAGVQVPDLQIVKENVDGAVAAQGVELQMKTNHLGHFLLVRLLLPHLPSTVRVVVVSSDSHKLARDAKRMKLHERWTGGDYHSLLAYAESKLANILFALELNRRLANQGLLAVSVHPGVVPATNLGRHMPANTHSNSIGSTWPTKSIEQGTGAILFCALAPRELMAGGAYYADCKEARCSKLGRNAALASAFFEQSEIACGLPPLQALDDLDVGT